MNNPNKNGISIELWRNQPNHFNYDAKVEASLQAIRSNLENQYGKDISAIDPNVVSQQVKNFQYYLYNQIGNNPTLHLNDVPINYP
jgi:hypothetical protein